MTAQKTLGDIIKLPNKKASNSDMILNETLKTCRKEIFSIIAELAKACFKTGYFFDVFRKTITVVFRKDGKKDYSFLKNYRPITLKNTFVKIIEGFIVGRITNVFEKYNLLSRTQMEARKKRVTFTVLLFFITAVHLV